MTTGSDSGVTVVEFFDYRCGYCKRAESAVTKVLAAHPEVRFIFKEFPILGPESSLGAPVWRAGANQTTRLKTEVPLEIGGKKLAPGEYSLFVDLKEGGWTLIV